MRRLENSNRILLIQIKNTKKKLMTLKLTIKKIKSK